MKKLPKLISSDIGGTLLERVKTGIPLFTATVLNTLVQKGIPVALVTGFNYTTTLRCTENLDNRIYLMPQNGVNCIREGKVLWEHEIRKDELEEIIQYLYDQNHPIIFYQGAKGDFKNYYYSRSELILPGPFTRINKVTDLKNVTGVSTLVANEVAQMVKKNLTRIINDRYQLVYVRERSKSWLEIVQQRVRKDLALKRLCQALDIDTSRVIYFGDNFNDYEALKMVGYPVIMENSVPELKQEFDQVAGEVGKQGVGHFLNRMFNLNVNLNR